MLGRLYPKCPTDRVRAGLQRIARGPAESKGQRALRWKGIRRIAEKLAFSLSIFRVPRMGESMSRTRAARIWAMARGVTSPSKTPKATTAAETRTTFFNLFISRQFIHLPFIRRLSGQTVANTGSTCVFYDGDPRASYLLIDDSEPSIRRVAYDIETEFATRPAPVPPGPPPCSEPPLSCRLSPTKVAERKQTPQRQSWRPGAPWRGSDENEQ